jgi:hypothetical protein
MRFRKRRIAWSMAWGVVAILLVALWVRSYAVFDSVGIGSHCVSSVNGRLYFDENFIGKDQGSDGAKVWYYQWEGNNIPYVAIQFQNAIVIPSGNGWRLPYWLTFVSCISVCAAPWINWSKRFSLRTLLIATTLVAVVLGLIVAATR